MTNKDEASLHDRIATFVSESENGVSSAALAERFLFFKSPDPSMAHVAVKSILSKDRRFSVDDAWVWRVKETSSEGRGRGIDETPWAAVYVLSDEGATGKKPIHFSAWALEEVPSRIGGQWLVSPAGLSPQDQQLLNAPIDEPWDHDSAMSVVETVSLLLQDRPVFFLNYRHQGLWTLTCNSAGAPVSDDTMISSQMLKILGLSVPRPLTLSSLCSQLFGNEPSFSSADKFGESFANCVNEMLRQTSDQGFVYRHELEKLEQERTLLLEWSKRAFSAEEIAAFPHSPGVYGFKGDNGEYIYIGKASNLSRRLMSYFRETDESPQKLRQLRDAATDLTIHRCGSELESLLTEYRLIKKHHPVLNTQMDINERKGQFAPVDDCIVLLPHAEAGRVMSVWIRREQAMRLKALDQSLEHDDNLRGELDAFFFSHKIPPSKEDFAELEIAARWLRQHRDGNVIVPVSRMGTVDEVIQACNVAWVEVVAEEQ